MSTKKSLAARLLTRAFRLAPTGPARRPATRPAGGLGRRIEELEDRSVPALATVASFLNDGLTPYSPLTPDGYGNWYGTTSDGGTAGGYGSVFKIATDGTFSTVASFDQANGALPYGGVTLDAAGNLYGTTSNGGANGLGTVFEIPAGTGTVVTLVSFDVDTTGAVPNGGLVFGPDANLYGTTSEGGPGGGGTVFEVAPDGSNFSIVGSFDGTNGSAPYSGVVFDAAGNLYGTTTQGGTNNNGTVFEIAAGTTTVTTLVAFDSTNGRNPQGGVTVGPDGNLYGTTYSGGANNRGTVFEVTVPVGTLTTLATFDVNTGQYPAAGVVFGPDGNLYGTTLQGGVYSSGTVFEVDAGGGAVNTVASFDNTTTGAVPQAGVTFDAAGNLYGTTSSGGAGGYGTVFEIPAGTSSITTLKAFGNPDGANPYGGVTFDAAGNLYGTTSDDGPGGFGTVFEVLAGTNTIVTLASFDYDTTGGNPFAGVTIGPDGNLYGTTSQGGAFGSGTVFEYVFGSGTLTALVSFDGSNGSSPTGGVTFGPDGKLYGTTNYDGPGGSGTVFRVEAPGSVTTLVSFDGTNGAYPQGGVAFDAAGNLYGTTNAGGTFDAGTVFEIPAGGSFTILAEFDYDTTGGFPAGGVTVGPDGNLYGTTSNGGAADAGTVFEFDTGTGTLATLAEFDINTTGAYPNAGVVFDAAGNLYGTAIGGGATDQGTVYEVAAGSGTITPLASFDGPHGISPFAGVTFGPDGNLYGTTAYGGASGIGAVFQVTLDSLSATTDGSGNLTVADAGAQDDQLSVAVVNGDLVITDATEPFASAPAGWTLSPDGHSISTPLNSFAGSIAFNGGGGDDTLVLDYSAGMLPDIRFDGGAGGNDRLVVGGDGTTTAVYSPSAASTAGNHQGTVQITGAAGTSTVTFANLEPVDVHDMGAADLATLTDPSATPLGSGNDLTVSNGTASTVPGQAAIVVSGTTDGGATAIEQVAFWNVGTVSIDTSGIANSTDTVTVAGADGTAANVTNLVVSTGTDAGDVVHLTGPVTVDGSLALTSETVTSDSGTTATTGTGLTVTVTAAGGSALDGTIAGAGGLTKAGAGTLAVSGPNTYTGDTTISGGTLRLGAADVIPDGFGYGNVVLNPAVGDTATLDLNGNSETVNGLSSSGAGTSIVTNGSVTAAATLTVGNNDATSTFGGNITDLSPLVAPLALAKTGGGTLTLTGSNTYDGVTAVNGGTLVAGSGSALGSTAAGTAVSGVATLDVQADIGTEGISIGGGGVGGTGALVTSTGTGTVGGPVGLTATAAVGGAGSLTINGAVADAGMGFSLVKVGAGTTTLGNTGNSYGGDTLIFDGTLRLGAADVIPDGAGAGNVVLDPIAGGDTATLDLNTFDETVNGLSSFGAGTSVVDTAAGGTPTLTVGNNDATSTFGGVIQNTAGALALTKQGAGDFTLAGANTYTGPTAVDAGRLILTGSVTSDVTVNPGGTLAGTGTVNGNVSGAGTFAPGLSPGVFTINGDFTPAGTLQLEVNPPAMNPGSDYDQYVVSGNVDLSGATLQFSQTADNGAVAPNQLVTLIANNGPNPTVPSADPAQGSTVTIGTTTYYVFYNGGDGNDVVLVEASTPGTVYVDDDFTQNPGQPIADADQGRNGDQPAVFGVTAFATVADALAHVAPGGTVVVNGGTYHEAVSLTGTVTLEVTGPDAAQTVTIDSLDTAAGTTVQIDGSSTLAVGDATDTTVAGALQGSGTLVKQGDGTLSLTAANPGFTGPIAVDAGTLRVTADGALGDTAHGTAVAAGATLLIDNTFYGSFSFPFVTSEPVTLTGGTLAGVGTSSFFGPVTLGADSSVSAPAASDSFTVVSGFTDAGAGYGLTKAGAGLVVLSPFFFGGGGTYTGTTAVDAGTLEVDLDIPGSTATVAAGATLTGIGTVGGVQAAPGGIVDPGPTGNSSAGTLSSNGDVALTPGSTFTVLLNGPQSEGPPTSDQLAVTGQVALNDATLTALDGGAGTPTFGDRFVLIENDGTDPVMGTFAGLPEGGTFVVGGVAYQITYAGNGQTGGGNDVILTAVPDLTVSDVSQAEGDAGATAFTFTLTLSGPSSQPISVDYATADGSATTADGDYVPASGQVVFLPGETSRTVTVYVTGDTKLEDNETFTLNLSRPVNVRLPNDQSSVQATGTILNDDAPPAVSVGDVAQYEGNTGQTAFVFTVSLSNPSDQTVTATVDTADGTATAGSDYTPVSGLVLTFEPGQTTQTVTVYVTGDTTYESDEDFSVNLSNATNATIDSDFGSATGTILNDDPQPTVTIGDATVTEGNAGTRALVFTLTLSNPTDQPATVFYVTADGTATAADNDYQPASDSVTFAPGQTTQTVSILVNGDTTFEPDETLTVQLVDGINVGPGAVLTGTGTIVNDDPRPVISVDDASVTEGTDGTTTLTFTVSLSNPSDQPVTVAYSTTGITAAAGSDFLPASGTLTFDPGVTTQTVDVTVNGDTVYEPDETLALDLSAATGGSIGDGHGVGTILNDDARPTVGIVGPEDTPEGDSGTTPLTFTIFLSNPSSETVAVGYQTVDGTATAADGDYQPVTGSVVFAPGETTKTITVLVNGDLKTEGDETFDVTLFSPANADVDAEGGSATATILNDDAAPTVSIGDVTRAEGNAGQTAFVFTVTLSNPSSTAVTVDYATADGTAAAGTDYAAAAGTLTFAPGQTTQTVTVLVSGDTTYELDETFTVGLSNAAGATIGTDTGTGTIVNDDGVPVISVDDVTAAEGNSGTTPFVFTLTLSNPSSTPVTVNYRTLDGSAAAGSDYAAASGTVSFDPGDTSKTVTVLVTGDTTYEPDETFTLHLSGAAGATLGGGDAVGTITNDDPRPTASIAIGNASQPEGNSGTTPFTFTVTLSNPSSTPVTVDYATADGTATVADHDYQPASGTLTFAPGETTKTVTVLVNGDTTAEPDETFTVTLSNPTGATIGTDTGTGTIVNDDGVPAVTVAGPSAPEGNSGTTPFVFTVTLSNPSSTPVVLTYATRAGTAAAGSDYLPASGTVTFATGQTTQTVTVQVIGDTVTEPDETFFLDVTGTGEGAGTVSGAATILNDDAAPVVAIGTGAGAPSQVRTYNGTTRQLGSPVSILSHPEFAGGTRVVSGDVNNDGVDDVIAGTGPGGGSTVVVIDGKTGQEIRRFGAYESSFTGGVFVAAADLNGDGYAEIVTAPDQGGGARVRVFDGKTGAVLADFLGIDDWSFRGGARVALGDVNHDGTPDLVVGAGFGGGPRVAVFDGTSLRPGTAPVKLAHDFFAFDGPDVANLRNGVYVAVGDVDGDGYGDLVFGAGPDGAPRVRVLSGQALVAPGGGSEVAVGNFFAGDRSSRGGVRVAARDLDQDGHAEVVTGAGDGQVGRVTIYTGSSVRPTGTPAVYDDFEGFPGMLNGVFVG